MAMIKLIWYGTATILLDVEGEKLLFDPFFRLNTKLPQPPLGTFTDVDFIFNTHAHLDHTSSLPEILKNSSATLYAPPTSIACLEKAGAKIGENVFQIKPGQKITTRNALVIAHKSKHVKFDLPLILRTVFRSIFKFHAVQAIKLLKLNSKFKMKGEILAYEINCKDKKIFLMGSAGRAKDIDCPQNVDVLVFPFQGHSSMAKYSMPIIDKIRPKTIVVDHFDDAYPPITHHMKTSKFIELVQAKYPEIQIIQPQYGEEFNL